MEKNEQKLHVLRFTSKHEITMFPLLSRLAKIKKYDLMDCPPKLNSSYVGFMVSNDEFKDFGVKAAQHGFTWDELVRRLIRGFNAGTIESVIAERSNQGL